jgi:hypothetical protein
MDPDLLMALLGDISEKLTTVVDLLVKIESNTSSIDSNTSSTDSNTYDISGIKNELDDIHDTIKRKLK